MKKIKIDADTLLERIRSCNPVVHHLTNWVTIYDCANIVKVMGASPVMAHAKEEVAEMAKIASSLVLNIGTLTVDFIESMKVAAKSANEKDIPVVLDVCGAGATKLRDRKSLELLDKARIDIIKGNASEIARISGENVKTKGVDAVKVNKDMVSVAKKMAQSRKCTIVVTGKEDIITNGRKIYIIKNGHPVMSHVVGTGCMATSVIGAFAAVESDFAYASASALVCFEIAAECAAKKSKGPGTFKEQLFDCLYHLDKRTINRMQKVAG
ncbi:MAG: hydroxyethylthiazole kinase [Candidatus Omnitrophota bacterium]